MGETLQKNQFLSDKVTLRFVIQRITIVHTFER